MKREFTLSNMSNTSEEESHATSLHQPLMGNCVTAPSKADTAAAPAVKKRRSLPGNPGALCSSLIFHVIKFDSCAKV